MRYRFEIENDHFQILLGDRVYGPLVDTMHLWDSGGRVAAMPNAPELVGLGTARYGGKTRIEVEITTSPPGPQSGWTSMGELSLYVPSGELVLWGPEALNTDQAPAVTLEPGRYFGSAFSRGTDAVIDEMATEGPDEYVIVLWKAA
jgi:hypothetical protein